LIRQVLQAARRCDRAWFGEAAAAAESMAGGAAVFCGDTHVATTGCAPGAAEAAEAAGGSSLHAAVAALMSSQGVAGAADAAHPAEVRQKSTQGSFCGGVLEIRVGGGVV
jgi:hypothetical protein